MKHRNALPTAALPELLQNYLNDCELRLLSPRTLESRHGFLRNLLWFLHTKGHGHCGVPELRGFFYYLAHGHEEAGGRFGHPNLNRPAQPITIKDYYVCFRAFFEWIVQIGALAQSPFDEIPKPRALEYVKPPLSTEHIARLLQAAQEGVSPERDTAILYMLLDTGCRAGELIKIRLCDIDLDNRSCLVLGKGKKFRTVYFGERAAKAVKTYLLATGRTDRLFSGRDQVSDINQEEPLFLSNRGPQAPNGQPLNSQPLTRSGLLQLTLRWTKRSGVKMSCSPHAFRRTFAVQTLRNGANVFSVQAMLGHADIQMTQRYCAIAQADVEAQHRRFSPLDRMPVMASGMS